MFTHAVPKTAQMNADRDGAQTARERVSAAATQTTLDRALNGSTQVQSQLRLATVLNQSPRAAAQTKLVQMMTGAGVTPFGRRPEGQGISDEDELIQYKAAAQRQPMADEDDLLQQSAVQRAEATEDELAQMKGTTVQRDHITDDELTQMQAADDDELLQPMAVQRKGTADDDELLQPMPAQRKANTTGMPDRLKSGIEGLSGLPMDGVRVHYNSPKPASLQAHAYTQGSDIHVAPGQEQHLAHEAWHVVQQAQGRVQPTMQLQGTTVNDDPALEDEADVMGAKALQMVHQGRTAVQHRADAGVGERAAIDSRAYQLTSAGTVAQLVYLWDRSAQPQPVWSEDEPPPNFLQSGRYDDQVHGEDDLYARLGQADLFYGISYEEGEHEDMMQNFLSALQEIATANDLNVESGEGFATAIRIYESQGNVPVLDVAAMNALYGGSSGWAQYTPYLQSGQKASVSAGLRERNPGLPWAQGSAAGLACQVAMVEAIKDSGSVRFLLDGLTDIKGIVEGTSEWSQSITSHELRFALSLLGRTINVGEGEQIVPQDGVNVFFYLNRRLIPADWLTLSTVELARAMARKLAEEEEWDEEDEEEGLAELQEALGGVFTAEQLLEVLSLP